MKYQNMSTEEQQRINTEKGKGQLYHLLFIGRISLKEYLEKVKSADRKE